ncbi:DUF4113 domain-containing protein [Petrimonas sp.]
MLEVIDALNPKYHIEVVRLSTQDTLKHKLRQEHLSLYYTTEI